MADNETTQSATLATLPAGVTYAFDDVGGVKIARSKTGFGTDGSYTDVSASDPLPVVATALGTLTGAVDETAPGTDTASSGLNGRLQRIAQRLTTIIGLLPSSLGAGGGLKVDGSGTALPVSLSSLPALAAGTNAIGKLAANSGVDIGDVDVTSTVLPVLNATSAVTSVADTATSTTLLSSSASRKGFRITNTSSAVLYVKYGTTASATDFTARLPQWAYLEENFYSGRVDGVWASDPGDGAALITSLSA